MMGEGRVMQEALFYGFSLERHIPDNHLLRRIDRFVDLSEVRTHLEPYYSETGRPSIDPELMIRMLIVGYGFGIRSERRLCDEVHLNLAYGFVTPPRACGILGSRRAKRMKKISYRGYRFPTEIIHQAIWLYLRFTLSLRDVEDLLAERGVALSYEAVRRWVNHFGR